VDLRGLRLGRVARDGCCIEPQATGSDAASGERLAFYRFDDAGKVIEHWGMNDGLTLLMQLGAIPAPGG